MRAQIAGQVRDLPAGERRQSSDKICQILLASSLYRGARTVFCFVGTSREIDTGPVLRQVLADGRTLCVPRCVGPGRMEARRIGSLEDLRPGAYGIPEPGPESPLVPPEDIDLALIPGAAGSRDGRRLGYGGGFYDRYLPATRCPRVLLCRELFVREDVPEEPHDARMDFLVTESGIYPCR